MPGMGYGAKTQKMNAGTRKPMGGEGRKKGGRGYGMKSKKGK